MEESSSCVEGSVLPAAVVVNVDLVVVVVVVVVVRWCEWRLSSSAVGVGSVTEVGGGAAAATLCTAAALHSKSEHTSLGSLCWELCKDHETRGRMQCLSFCVDFFYSKTLYSSDTLQCTCTSFCSSRADVIFCLLPTSSLPLTSTIPALSFPGKATSSYSSSSSAIPTCPPASHDQFSI